MLSALLRRAECKATGTEQNDKAVDVAKSDVTNHKAYNEMSYAERRILHRLEDREMWNAYFKLMKLEAKGTVFTNIKYYSLRAMDIPVTWFREKVMEPLQDKYKKPYYHYTYDRVRDIDECLVNDEACIYEANIQFSRDMDVDRAILTLLRDRVINCQIYHGDLNVAPCVPAIEDAESAELNYFIKYGEMHYNATALDCYMKQKHRLIWERQHPEVMQARQKEYIQHKDELKRGIFDMSFWKNEMSWALSKDYMTPVYMHTNTQTQDKDRAPQMSRDWQYYKDRDGKQATPAEGKGARWFDR